MQSPTYQHENYTKVNADKALYRIKIFRNCTKMTKSKKT